MYSLFAGLPEQNIISALVCGPVGPVGPLAPIEPVNPVGPVGPVPPPAPCDPVYPTSPVRLNDRTRLALLLGKEPDTYVTTIVLYPVLSVTDPVTLKITGDDPPIAELKTKCP